MEEDALVAAEEGKTAGVLVGVAEATAIAVGCGRIVGKVAVGGGGAGDWAGCGVVRTAAG